MNKESLVNTPAKIPFLTKSRFQTGMECPTKLYYQLNSKKYPNQKLDDPFLEALAKGGFQVGALARAYYPEGILVNEISNDLAIERTGALLQQDNCTLFEAAIKAGPYLIRIDILKKRGNVLELIEVKAKSFNPAHDSFLTAKGKISAPWLAYLSDVAFQSMVLRKMFPTVQVNCFLMLVDKSKTATVDGLNQKFKIINENGRVQVRTIGTLTEADLGERILTLQPVNNEVELLQTEQIKWGEDSFNFHSFADRLANNIAEDQRWYVGIGTHCNKCEFQTQEANFVSGFKECWKNQTGLTDQQLEQPLLFELWRGNLGSKDILSPLFDRQDYFLRDFVVSDYASKSEKVCDGFSATDRRTLQIQKSVDGDQTPAYNSQYLEECFASFTYPLHFIDFETTALAIPMYAGRRPYEQIAFQFSHHVMEQDGKISHRTQWLNDEVGAFPNFNFVRALKRALEKDRGTIFRYHNHENTILNVIHEQLLESDETDKKELCEFICTITHKKERTGERDMVDLYKLVIGGFYQASMKGSNSIKVVLPAMIECSEFLQNKYSTACYGTKEMPSLNFPYHTWLQKDAGGKWNNPYKSLPPIFEGIDSDLLDAFCGEEGEELADGGAAMMTYAKMQFTDMSDEERSYYHNALLRYCELDTLAMVMIYEGWKDYLLGQGLLNG